MLEKHSPQLEQAKPSPEEQRAFRSLYNQIMRMVTEQGEPVEVVHYGGNSVLTRNREKAEQPQEKPFVSPPFAPNAKEVRLRMTDTEGGIMLTLGDEQVVHDGGVLGYINIRKGAGPLPLDLYKLNTDQTVGHVEVLWEREDGEPTDYTPSKPLGQGHEVVNDLGQLSSDQIEALQLQLEQSEALLMPE